MRKLFILFLLAMAVVVVFSAKSMADDKSTVTIVNHSEMAIHNLFLSPVGKNEWGPDQLQDHTIEPGTSVALHGIPCNSYDVKLVDEDGEDCVLGGVAICAENQGWDISTKDLAACKDTDDDDKDDDDKDDQF